MIAWSQYLCLQLSGSLTMSQATPVSLLTLGLSMQANKLLRYRLMYSCFHCLSFGPLKTAELSSKPAQGTESCLKIFGVFSLILFRPNWLGLFCSCWITKTRRVSGTATGSRWERHLMEAVYACKAVGRNSVGTAEKASQVKGFKKPKSPNC